MMAGGLPWTTRLGDVLFGHDPRLRIRVRLCFIAGVIYLGWIGIMTLAMNRGLLIHSEAGYPLMVGQLFLGLAFYPLIRSGKTAHLADPALVVLQMIIAYAVCAYSYVIAPDSRGSLLQVMCLIQVFGLLSLTRNEVRIVGAAATIAALAAWVGGTLWAPAWAFDPTREAINLTMAAFIMMLLTIVSDNYSQMRADVRTQKKVLTQAVQQVEHIVAHDPLTGLFNRRHMVEIIEREVSRAERSGVGMALVLIDLDHFKQVNDTHGHQVGDEVLQAFADIAQAALRETDLVGRWGGEEFILLLPDTHPADRAMIAIDRIQHTLLDAIVCAKVPELRLAFSAGVAVPRADESLDAMLERADQALYTAKHQGRQRGVIAD